LDRTQTEHGLPLRPILKATFNTEIEMASVDSPWMGCRVKERGRREREKRFLPV